METNLIILSFLFTVFMVFFYVGMTRKLMRFKRYKTYAQVIYTKLIEHYEELSAKRDALIVDKGYNVVDPQPWIDEMHKFISIVIAPALPKSLQATIKKKTLASIEFSSFACAFLVKLLDEPKKPSGYDLDAFTQELEDTDRIDSFFKGEPAYNKGMKVTTRLAGLMLLIAFVGHQGTALAEDAQGFAPITACNALADEPGFSPSNWSELYEGKYTCGTKYKDLGQGALPNNLSMYGMGTKAEVTRVRLMLNVNVKSRAGQDQKTLAGLCTKMTEALIGDVPQGYAGKIAAGTPFESDFNGYRVALTKEVWKTGKGFELNCIVATKYHKE
ncbi:hypothetical protein HNP46_005739 [Pseudomonas nitritireducens]|uniref:Uncharacterized protein n=1 Tax=Pseudomonas nitroreducens TaxID=46680 RepID=A0A7W7KPZ2_PSENT|nr:DUF6030 family protein [Pseudomonas nitritireducens]MBB4866832.1 hypothetical protein [Pseudomonas nitritireducens]